MAVVAGQDRVNLGPLTQVFTPPFDCAPLFPACTTCNFGWKGQECGPDGVRDATSCWPPTSQGIPAPTGALFGWGFYSPGVHCPAGYTSACTATAGPKTTSQGWPVQFVMEKGETAIGCCSSNYACANINGQTCVRVVQSTSVRTVYCDGVTTTNLGSMTLPNEYASMLTLYAPMIQINFQSSDISGTTSGASSRGTATSDLAAATAPPAAGAANNVNGTTISSTPSNGLSAGAIAGIGVGLAALILAIGLATLLLWRKRRRQAAAAAGDKDADSGIHHLHEIDSGGPHYDVKPSSESSPVSLSEAPGSEPPPAAHKGYPYYPDQQRRPGPVFEAPGPEEGVRELEA
ncbi:hypothetical protein B0T26DRAFT_643555 [Lasiosphaeria miniovina]|uniref:Uncharacterized protein n=1 Tax=Lasiosphaeria miniovina TaxID=1954250 RepID=A0AA40ATS9_9PEZI|nr:uncharacterized protein B0T26DRAFT_643555 [Lasiosphaeria miniovina]KAK0721869.1 hypothetical protein B0T26DRAFT_643555 [Lasiosphaeria miniovina]